MSRDKGSDYLQNTGLGSPTNGARPIKSRSGSRRSSANKKRTQHNASKQLKPLKIDEVVSEEDVKFMPSKI